MVLRFFLVFCLFIPVASANPLKLNDTAPDWSLQTAKGETVNYHNDSEGNVTMVLFWATWCPYCRSLMPHLEVIYRQYRSKGLKFYAVNVFEENDPVKYFTDQKFSSTLLLNGDEVAAEWGVKGTPGLFVLDKEKKIIYKRPSGVSDVMVKQNIDLKLKYAVRK